MTYLEKAINLGYLFLTYKPEKNKNPINTCTSLFFMYWYFSIYSEECFWPQYMYHKMSPNNGFCWCPLGKLSHLGLEQLLRLTEFSVFVRQELSAILEYGVLAMSDWWHVVDGSSGYLVLRITCCLRDNVEIVFFCACGFYKKMKNQMLIIFVDLRKTRSSRRNLLFQF